MPTDYPVTKNITGTPLCQQLLKSFHVPRAAPGCVLGGGAGSNPTADADPAPRAL